MAIRIVQLGSPRHGNEGLRIGTVRRPPRAVSKTAFASGHWYHVWFPTLAPSVETMKLGQAAKTRAQWAAFSKTYRGEMSTPHARHAIALLAALSHTTHVPVGCYRDDESHCHRSVLRALLTEHGATIAIARKGLSPSQASPRGD